MERLDKPIYKVYLPLVIFLDDLENVERILKASCKSVAFEAAQYRFQSWSEFVAQVKANRLKAVEMTGRDPYLSVNLDSMSARLYAASSDDVSAGIFYKLDAILSPRTRTLRWLFPSATTDGETAAGD